MNLNKIAERSLKQQKSLSRKLAFHANESPGNVYQPFASSEIHKLTLVAHATTIIEELVNECKKINKSNLLRNPANKQKY